MSLKIAITGLPNVGKSTLFNALTRNNVLAANYPFATIEPNVGIVSVPDERLGKLARLYDTKQIVPATVTFVDIAGLVRGASEGQGLGNKFLANIRECDAICQVVRAFSDPNVQHVDGGHDPARDIETINTELILADIQSIDGRLGKIGKDPSKRDLTAALQKAREVLDQGTPLSIVIPSNVEESLGKSPSKDPSTALRMTEKEIGLLSDMQLLTAKPFIYVFNLDENDLKNAELQTTLQQLVTPAEAIFLCAKIESELSELPPEDVAELLQDLGQTESGLQQLIRVGYNTLGLQTFLTAGPKEVRAWTVRRGATAPQAAGEIHTDFEKGFIRAEVVSYDDLIAAGSLPAARAAGKARLEGKDYIMQPDDVVEFRFNI